MNKRQGITLMEMMLGLVMVSILASAFTFVFFMALKNWNYQRQRLEVREPAIWALENISKDLRQARSVTLGNASRITFTVSPYETIDYNRVLSSGLWQVVRTYTLSTTPATSTTAAVAGGAIGGTTTFIRNTVSAFTLQYYNSSGTLISTPVPPAQLANIRLVRITLSLQSTLLLNTETVTLRTEIRLRNL